MCGLHIAQGMRQVPSISQSWKRPKIRGDEQQAEQQLEQKRAQLGNLRGQIAQDVRDSILDIQSAQQQVSVAESNRGLAARKR